MKNLILAILLITCTVGAAELNVVLVGNKQLAGSNCRTQGGPNFYDVSANIQNPSGNHSIRISYLFYNSSSGTFVNGGDVCQIASGRMSSCTFRVYTVTGGVNGTDQIPFKVVGVVGDICGNGAYCGNTQEYDAMLNVTITHYTSVYEENILSKLETAAEEYTRVSAEYEPSCYNTSEYGLLETAYYKIQNSTEDLSACDLQDALATVNDAINNISNAEVNKPSCEENQTVNKTQPTPPPPSPPVNNSTVTKPNVTLNETPPAASNNNTNTGGIVSTLRKVCLPFSIIAALFIAAVWSERKRISA